MRFASILLALFALGAAPTAPAQATFERSEAVLETATGRHRLDVELAVTPGQRAQGLMFREELPADYGMLFDFGTTRPISMWMANTYVPLDMLFIAADGRITQIVADTQPLTDTMPLSRDTIPSGLPAYGVLELPAGAAERYGVEPGDRVVHPRFDG